MTDADPNQVSPPAPSSPASGSGRAPGSGATTATKRPQRHRRGGSDNARPVDFWRVVPPLPAPEPIAPAGHPSALIESLGVSPLPGRAVEHYIAAVVERASGLATALAASAGLLVEPEREPDE